MVRRAFALLAVLAVAAGCVVVYPDESTGLAPSFPAPPEPGPSGGAHPQDRGDLRLVWPASTAPPYQAYLEALQEEGAVPGWVATMNRELALPQDVRVVHTQCGMENAYYSPDEKAVVLCWELLDRIASVMRDASSGTEELERAMGSAWLFVLFHEVGHALVDVYDLPVTGREEDAVDDLATLTLIEAGASNAAVEASIFWLLSDTGSYSGAQFADEHSLHPQRFYSILCTVYGSDQESWAAIVGHGYLSPERAQRCVLEYERKSESWDRLLDPWRQA